MKCDELKEYKAYEYGTSYVYDIGEVKEAIAELKARIQLDDDEMEGFLQLEEECGGGDLRKYIAELKEENERLKKQSSCTFSDDCLRVRQLQAKLEDVQASAYAEMVDAGMRERRLRRALWLARANTANNLVIAFAKDVYLGSGIITIKHELARTWMKCKLRDAEEWEKIWLKVERKCRAKAEEYK